MNNKQIASIIGLILAIIIVVFVVRSCMQTREVELRQKSTDTKTELSLEIEKEKAPKQNNPQY